MSCEFVDRAMAAVANETYSTQSHCEVFLDQFELSQDDQITEEILNEAGEREPKLPQSFLDFLKTCTQPTPSSSDNATPDLPKKLLPGVKVKEIFVITRSPLAKKWIEDNEKSFAAAVSAHMSATGKNTNRFVREIAQQDEDTLEKSHASFSSSSTQQQKQKLDRSFNLFPPDPNTKALKEKSGSALISLQVDYKLFSSGYDILGEWHVDPLGYLVEHVLVLPCETQDDEDDDITVNVAIDPASKNILLDDPMSKKMRDDFFIKAELHKLYRFVVFYLRSSTSLSSGSSAQIQSCGHLDRNVVREGLSRAAAKVRNDRMFVSVESIFNRMTDPLVDPPRGLLLYGPPGTGNLEEVLNIARIHLWIHLDELKSSFSTFKRPLIIC